MIVFHAYEIDPQLDSCMNATVNPLFHLVYLLTRSFDFGVEKISAESSLVVG